MDDPERLRTQAVQLYALAIQIRDSEPAYANMLIERAEELQAQATAIEEATKLPPATDAAQPPAQQPSAQFQEQIPPEEDEE